jgi:hypothetical protein
MISMGVPSERIGSQIAQGADAVGIRKAGGERHLGRNPFPLFSFALTHDDIIAGTAVVENLRRGRMDGTRPDVLGVRMTRGVRKASPRGLRRMTAGLIHRRLARR